MHKQYILSTIGLSIALLGLLFSTLIPAVEAFDWDSIWKPTKYEKWDCCSNSSLKPILNLEWHWTKYEKWNCCPGYNPSGNFKPIPNSETISSNEIIQNIEVNQVCEYVQNCLIDLHDLNSQINYSDK